MAKFGLFSGILLLIAGLTPQSSFASPISYLDSYLPSHLQFPQRRDLSPQEEAFLRTCFTRERLLSSLSLPLPYTNLTNGTTVPSPNQQFVPLLTDKPFNLRITPSPVAIVSPDSLIAVNDTINCMKKSNVKVVARSGGHSYGAMGLGGPEVEGVNVGVIDLGRFNQVEPSGFGDDVVRVGAGIRLGNLATKLYEDWGGRALPHGVCPGVGLGGHALHGGFGFTSRMWGTTLDNIVAMEVVLPDGTIKLVDEAVHPELFWAFRGAGSSFGVVTTFYLRTYAAPETGFHYTINIPSNLTSTVESRVQIFLKLQEYCLTAPKELALRVSISGFAGFGITGVYWGVKAAFDEVIAPLLASLGGPYGAVTARGTALGWIQSLQRLANGQNLKQPEIGYDTHETLYAKSLVTSDTDLMTAEQITPFFEFLQNNVRNATWTWWVLLDLYGGGNSVISTTPLSSSSYPHRNSLFTFQFYSNPYNQRPPYPAAGIPWLNKMVSSITDRIEADGGEVMGYANYNDPLLTAAEAHKLYYGNRPWNGVPGAEGVYDRLKRIKKQVDPGMVIWNPQAIGLD